MEVEPPTWNLTNPAFSTRFSTPAPASRPHASAVAVYHLCPRQYQVPRDEAGVTRKDTSCSGVMVCGCLHAGLGHVHEKERSVWFAIMTRGNARNMTYGNPHSLHCAP